MKLFRTMVLVIGLVACLTVPTMAESEFITLPNGQTLDITNLTDQQVQNAVEIAIASMREKKEVPKEALDKAVEAAKKIKPEDLNEWRILITGTIKDICNDLNVTVNEFVKTPVGLGIAIAVLYKMMGSDMLEVASDIADIFLVIPFWCVITTMLLVIGNKFFGHRTMYNKIYYDDNKRKVKEGPVSVPNYDWDGKSRDARTTGIVLLCIAEFLFTIIALLLVFC